MTFEYYDYFVILGYDEGQYECYPCKTMQDVYQTLTERIHDELDYMINSGGGVWSNDAEINAFAHRMLLTETIDNKKDIIRCYSWYFAGCWWFKVLNKNGAIELEGFGDG
jgi:hypothetical protein